MFSIEIDLTSLASSLPADAYNRLTRQLLSDTLDDLRSTWESAVTGTALPGMARTVTDLLYRDAIADPSATLVPYGASLSGAIVPHDQDRVTRTETGYPRFDMKPKLLASSRARITGSPFNQRPMSPNQRKAFFAKVKAGTVQPSIPGKRYVVIPFRHGRVPGTEGDHGFAVISDNSPPDSWIHPGLPARPVMEPVARAVASRVEETIRRILERIS